MVDTTTTVLGFVKQTVGGNRNAWGSILNSTLDMVEEAICGRNSVVTTGGTTTLTQAQARKYFQDISGTLLSDATIVVPNGSKTWVFNNITTGGFAVLVKTASGDPTSVPQLTERVIVCGGFNNVARADIDDVGKMAFFATPGVPAGWMECNGATPSRAGIGLDLFIKIGTTWGAGNGTTTFTLPDGYSSGKFLRARTASVAVGTDQSDQNKAHSHTNSASTTTTTTTGTTTTGSVTLSMSGTAASGGAHTHTGTTGTESAPHTHSVASSTVSFVSGGGTPINTVSGSTATGNESATHTHSFTTDSGGAHTHSVDFTGSSASTSLSSTSTSSSSSSTTVTVNSDGGTEARPTNLSALLCIRY